MNTLTFAVSNPGDNCAENGVRVIALIDGKIPAEDVVDVSAVLFGGAAERASFELYTCSCGIAGCAGYHQPLDQRREADLVHWKIEDEKLARVLGATELTFEAEAFDAARADLLSTLKALEAKEIYAESMLETDWDEGDNEILTGWPLDAAAAHMLPYYHGQTEMAKLREAATPAGEASKLRFSWHAPEGDTPERFTEMASVDVAANLLGLGESLRPENTKAAADLPAVAALVHDFARGKTHCVATENAFDRYRAYLKAEDALEDGADLFYEDEHGPFVRFS